MNFEPDQDIPAQRLLFGQFVLIVRSALPIVDSKQMA